MTIQKITQTLDGNEANSMTDETPNTSAQFPKEFFLQAALNLSDLTNKTEARSNLGLGTIATYNHDDLKVTWRDDFLDHVKSVLTYTDLQDTPNSYSEPQPYVGGAIARVNNESNAMRHADGVRIYQQRLFIGVSAIEDANDLQTLADAALLYVGDYSSNTAQFRVAPNGDCFARGTFNPGGADYAEMLESTTGVKLPYGTAVVLDGKKVRAAVGGDPASSIFGVIRAPGTSSVIGGQELVLRREKYVVDSFDQIQTTPTQFWVWDDASTDMKKYVLYTGPVKPDGVPSEATTVWLDIPQYQVGFSESTPQTPLVNRPAWNIVGLVGQCQVLNGQPVNPSWRSMGAHDGSTTMYLIGVA